MFWLQQVIVDVGTVFEQLCTALCILACLELLCPVTMRPVLPDPPLSTYIPDCSRFRV